MNRVDELLNRAAWKERLAFAVKARGNRHSYAGMMSHAWQLFRQALQQEELERQRAAA